MPGGMGGKDNPRHEVTVSSFYLDAPDTDPTGPEVGRFYVMRGGGWFSGLICCRVEGRNALPSNWSDFALGFRCAMDAPADPVTSGD